MSAQKALSARPSVSCDSPAKGVSAIAPSPAPPIFSSPMSGVETTITKKWPNGASYRGQWRDGQMNGQGTLVFADGCWQKGNFVNGKLHGFGEQLYGTGAIYKGQFKNGLRDGHGRMVWPRGNWHEGEYANNERHGFGIYQQDDGYRFEGMYEHNEYHGKGEEILPGKGIYVGEFRHNSRIGKFPVPQGVDPRNYP